MYNPCALLQTYDWSKGCQLDPFCVAGIDMGQLIHPDKKRNGTIVRGSNRCLTHFFCRHCISAIWIVAYKEVTKVKSSSCSVNRGTWQPFSCIFIRHCY